MVNCARGLTAREREILRLKALGLNDYRIARKLRVEAPSVTRSRLKAIKKIERVKAD